MQSGIRKWTVPGDLYDLWRGRGEYARLGQRHPWVVASSLVLTVVLQVVLFEKTHLRDTRGLTRGVLGVLLYIALFTLLNVLLVRSTLYIYHRRGGS